MADTLGDLIDKLTIENIRLWMLEDLRREVSVGKTQMQEKEMLDFLAKISRTNRKRNDLIDQINAGLRVLFDTKKSGVFIDTDTLLGAGKNKFYKTEDTE